MRITIELDTGETEPEAILKALKILQKGQKEGYGPGPEGASSSTEISFQPTARLPTPMGFTPPPLED